MIDKEKILKNKTMGIFKKENKIRKMNQRLKALEVSNPKMADKLRGQIASLSGSVTKT